MERKQQQTESFFIRVATRGFEFSRIYFLLSPFLLPHAPFDSVTPPTTPSLLHNSLEKSVNLRFPQRNAIFSKPTFLCHKTTSNALSSLIIFFANVCRIPSFLSPIRQATVENAERKREVNLKVIFQIGFLPLDVRVPSVGSSLLALLPCFELLCTNMLSEAAIRVPSTLGERLITT